MDLSALIHLLGDMLGQVLSEQESPAIFETEEHIRLAAKSRRAGDAAAAATLTSAIADLSVDQARAVAAAFATYFDLVNLAEENQRVALLRQQADASYPAPISESIAEAVSWMKRSGVSEAEMAALLSNLSIELVFTAHPTEARRRTILSKIQRIADLIDNLEQPGLPRREEQACHSALHAEITAFWLTDRARAARLTVTDEVRTGLYFIDLTLWQVLPQIYADLDAALAEHYPGLAVEHSWLRLASWMGGDRDGNPNVTSGVTAETLRLHRGLAVENHRRSLQELARRLSLSARRVPAPGELLDWIESRRPFPPRVAFIEQRYAQEPYRLVLSLLAADLAEASQDDMTSRLLAQYNQSPIARQAEASVREGCFDCLQTERLARPLEIITQAIPAPIAQDQLLTLRRQTAIFGLHTARLDIREEAGRLNAALGEILRALQIEMDFENASDADRVDLLTRLLAQPIPALAPHPGVTQSTAETFALFQMLERVKRIYGRGLLGPFIISMTASAADMLTVLLFARWTGCEDGMPIVPLFETIEDLQSAPQILTALFDHPIYQQHLHACGNEQIVMIGYSDSNKDGGYLMANWALYQTQDNIARVCRQYQVKLTLFHGRGGTVARGGGPANRAIRAQPPGTINGRFRLTEQGEIIAARYSHTDLAHRHLEQIVSAVLLASCPQSQTLQEEIPRGWDALMAQMAAVARQAYRALVYETPGFIAYWQAATPLDEIKRLGIGSRPAARPLSQIDGEQVNKIRAIPWVFSWMQSRFNLPGWYGLGAGLAAAESLEALQEMYAAWPFFRTLLDNTEMSLVKADMDIAALYSNLAPDRPLAENIFARIRAEYDLTCQTVLAVSRHSDLMESEGLTQRSVQIRNPYIDPLNYLQVEMLRRLRALPDPESSEASALREVIGITINGIASGLRNTG